MSGDEWRCVAMRGDAWRCVAMRGDAWRCVAMRAPHLEQQARYIWPVLRVQGGNGEQGRDEPLE